MLKTLIENHTHGTKWYYFWDFYHFEGHATSWGKLYMENDVNFSVSHRETPIKRIAKRKVWSSLTITASAYFKLRRQNDISDTLDFGLLFRERFCRTSGNLLFAVGFTETITSMFPPYPRPGFFPNFTGLIFDSNVSWYYIYENVSQTPQEALIMVRNYEPLGM